MVLAMVLSKENMMPPSTIHQMACQAGGSCIARRRVLCLAQAKRLPNENFMGVCCPRAVWRRA